MLFYMFIFLINFVFYINVLALPTSDPRIVGGEIVQDGEMPFIVSVRIFNQHICGGSILNKKLVLTAAHCVENWKNNTNYISIQYGVSQINPNGPNIIKVKNFTIHEKYNSSIPGYYNDLAILELNDTIKFGPTVFPIGLSNPMEDPEYEITFVAGWGLPYSNGPKQINLQSAAIIKYPDNYCYKLEKHFNSFYQFCGGLIEGGAGQCSGDSGGPVIINGKQFGVISWSRKPCASPNNPGIFVRISSYRTWIYQLRGV